MLYKLLRVLGWSHDRNGTNSNKFHLAYRYQKYVTKRVILLCSFVWKTYIFQKFVPPSSGEWVLRDEFKRVHAQYTKGYREKVVEKEQARVAQDARISSFDPREKLVLVLHFFFFLPLTSMYFFTSSANNQLFIFVVVARTLLKIILDY